MEGEYTHSLLNIHFARFLTARSGLSAQSSKLFYELAARLSGAMSAGHSCLPITEEERGLLTPTDLVSDGGPTPLIVHNSHLYLNRYFHYESRLADQIRTMAGISYDLREENGQLLDDYFGTDKADVDWQKRAAAVALEKRLTIISGGPGTGKTQPRSMVLRSSCWRSSRNTVTKCWPESQAIWRRILWSSPSWQA